MNTAELIVIGGGNMGQAIVFGLLHGGFTVPERIAVCEPDAAKRLLFEQRGVFATSSAADALARFAPGRSHLLLAIKPQDLAAVAAQLRPHLPGDLPVITILAGTPSEKVRTALGERTRIVRAMPNTALRVGAGVTAISAGAGATKRDCEQAARIFNGLGWHTIIHESLMDAFTALAGSGPAYLFYLAEAMTTVAHKLGFDAATTEVIVRQTLVGSAMLLAQSPDQSAAQLRVSVTSKGGTTEAAVKVLDDRAVMQAVIDAITAAPRPPGRELAGG